MQLVLAAMEEVLVGMALTQLTAAAVGEAAVVRVAILVRAAMLITTAVLGIKPELAVVEDPGFLQVVA
jgi:hypothetical protein